MITVRAEATLVCLRRESFGSTPVPVVWGRRAKANIGSDDDTCGSALGSLVIQYRQAAEDLRGTNSSETDSCVF